MTVAIQNKREVNSVNVIIQGSNRLSPYNPTGTNDPFYEPYTFYNTLCNDEITYYVYDHSSGILTASPGNTRITYTPTVMPDGLKFTLNGVYDYYPYGKILREYVQGPQEKYLTTHHQRDEEAGLDYRGARFYDCDVARFLSLDPLATQFASWSAYNYVMGNPILFTDPNGMEPARVKENYSNKDDPASRKSKQSPDNFRIETTISSTVINKDGTILHHSNDGDPNIYLAPDGWSIPHAYNNFEVVGQEKAGVSYLVGGNILSCYQPATGAINPAGGAFDILGFKEAIGMMLSDLPGGAVIGIILSKGKGANRNLPKLGAAQGKGERGRTRSAGGTDSPYKHAKPDPNKPGNILVKDPHSGKSVSKPAPADYPWPKTSKK